jgi:hypothetical protein
LEFYKIWFPFDSILIEVISKWLGRSRLGLIDIKNMRRTQGLRPNQIKRPTIIRVQKCFKRASNKGHLRTLSLFITQDSSTFSSRKNYLHPFYPWDKYWLMYDHWLFIFEWRIWLDGNRWKQTDVNVEGKVSVYGKSILGVK